MLLCQFPSWFLPLDANHGNVPNLLSKFCQTHRHM